MKVKIREFIRSKPLLYKVWLYFKTGYKDKLPDASTNLHLTGYQRSGNTYTSLVVKKLFPNHIIVTHFHAIASLKSALNNNVPVIVIIRHPKGAILSSLIKRVDARQEALPIALSYDLIGYKSYYEFVKEHIDQISVVSFDMVINELSKFVDIVSKKLDINKPNKNEIMNALEYSMQTLQNDKRQGADRNIKSDFKEKQKEKYIQQVEKNILYQECVHIYDELSNEI